MRLLEYLKQPRTTAIAGVILGLMLGLLIGWVVWPVEYTDAVPEILSQQHQEEYLRMAIDSYGARQNVDLAVQRWTYLGKNAVPLFAAISRSPGNQDVGAILGFKAAVEGRLGPMASAPISPQPTPSSTTTTPSKINIWWIVAGGLLALGVIGWAIYRYMLRPILFGKRPPTGEVSAARHAQNITNSAEKTDFAGMGLAKPITQTMTTYVLGDDLYDESFSIDAQSGDFLGEYGVGVSETMGVGEPKKVTAIEIWLFDKNDIKTATKVLMSPHAYGDQNIRTRLEAKGELVPIQPQEQVMLETATLQLLATVVDLEYGRGNLPDKSYFERITLELAIWPKG